MRIETFFPYRLAVTAEAFSRSLLAIYRAEYGLFREEWRLLFLLEDAGSLDSIELAQRTTLDKVQVSRAAQRLEEKGLILRTTSSRDRRLRIYTVTDQGRALFQRAFRQVEAKADEVLGRLSEADRAALLQGVAALQEALVTPPASDAGTRPGRSDPSQGENDEMPVSAGRDAPEPFVAAPR